MPNYRVSVTRTTSFWLYFSAEDKQKAEDLITAWECGEIDQEDIPDQHENVYNFETEINDEIESV
jgi:hypothetical protein